MNDDQSTVVTLKVRVTPEFREKIVSTAKQNNRSMNQEIVARLEQSFSQSSQEDAVSQIPTELLMMELACRMKGYSLTLEEIDRSKKPPEGG